MFEPELARVGSIEQLSGGVHVVTENLVAGSETSRPAMKRANSDQVPPRFLAHDGVPFDQVGFMRATRLGKGGQRRGHGLQVIGGG